MIDSSFSSYANRSARFISGLFTGLSGGELRKQTEYHGHRTLPSSMVAEVKKSTSNLDYNISIYIRNLNNRLNNYIPLLI